MQTEFVYIWKYIVKEENIDEFIGVYGRKGEWVRLFHESNDYIQTKLFSDINNPSTFITIDYWNNKEARDLFIKTHQTEYDEIDKRCETLTLKEELIDEYFLVK
jgi:hypothetical protein